ncbi:hypothetical protein M2322_004340 [Rhodoblastus acidophilus]|nr:hypothetical protein [Rhodoblastus acidophilus]
MTPATTLPVARPVAIPLREILPWALFGGLLLMLGIYFVGVEEGAVAMCRRRSSRSAMRAERRAASSRFSRRDCSASAAAPQKLIARRAQDRTRLVMRFSHAARRRLHQKSCPILTLSAGPREASVRP